MMMNVSKRLISIYLPSVQDIPLHQGTSWKPTWKSTTLTDRFISYYTILDNVRIRHLNSLNRFVNREHEMPSFITNVCKIHSFQDGFFSPGIYGNIRLNIH